jgi:urease accessory protein
LAAFADAAPEEALGVFLNQSVLGMIAAGVRGIPIGHTHAQQILAYLHGDLDELTRLLAGQDLQTAGSGSPYYEVLCHEQPRLYTRLFRS